jgi:hypothetical protein
MNARSLIPLWVGLLLTINWKPLTAQDEHELQPLRCLPDTTVAYLQVQPTRIVLDHPLRQQVQSSAIVQTLWNSEQLKQPRMALASFEFITANRIESVIRKLGDGGMHVAIDAQSQGALLLTKTESEKWLRDYLKRILLLIRNDAKNKQLSEPIKEREYRGFTGYEYQSNVFAAIGPWLLVTNKSQLAKLVIDRHLDSSGDSSQVQGNSASILGNPRFATWQKMVAELPQSADSINIANQFLDLDGLRRAGAAKELLAGKANDFGGELVLGGMLAVLQHTPVALGNLSLSSSGVRLDWQVPNQSDWIDVSREYFVGPRSSGVAPPLLSLPGTIFSLSAYRDLSQLWLRSGDLFDQRVNDALAQADNTLTTLFSGRDFAEDILGAIEPQLQIVVMPQIPVENQQLPSVKLPTFALRATLKNSGALQKELRRVFQNAIGFMNIVGAMEGNPQLDMQSEKDAKHQAEYHWAVYVPDSDKKYENGLPIHFNFQPSIAFQGANVVVSSHVDLARQIINNSQSPASAPQAKNNTLFSVDGAALTQALRANRDQLISNNVLEKGHSRKQAETEVDILLDALTLLRDFKGELAFETNSAHLSLQLNLTPQSKNN